MPVPRPTTSAGSSPREGAQQGGGGGGVADAHFAAHQDVSAPFDSLAAMRKPTAMACSASARDQGGLVAQIAGSPATDHGHRRSGWRSSRRPDRRDADADADVHHRDLDAALSRQDVDGRAAIPEVRHHGARHLGRIGAHRLGGHAMVRGKNEQLRSRRHRHGKSTAHASVPGGQFLQAAQTARRLGQLTLMGQGRLRRLTVEVGYPWKYQSSFLCGQEDSNFRPQVS